MSARFTGRDIDGGYAELTIADERYCLPLPDDLTRRAGGPSAVRRPDRLPRAAASRATQANLGLYGFGSAAHMICQVAVYQGRQVFAFTRPSDELSASISPRPSAPPGRAAATKPRPSPSMPRSSSRRPASWSPRRLKVLAPGGTCRLRRHPHERHPELPATRSCGASATFARSPTSPAETARSFSRSLRRSRSEPRSPPTPSNRRKQRSPTCAPAGSRAAP